MYACLSGDVKFFFLGGGKGVDEVMKEVRRRGGLIFREEEEGVGVGFWGRRKSFLGERRIKGRVFREERIVGESY